MKRLFLDSSVFFTAINSPTGGSAKLFTLKNTQILTSPVVLSEVERNVRSKLESYHLDRFFLLVSRMIVLDQRPDDRIIAKAKYAIAEKDAVILAEAKNANCDILVTLDRKHFLTPKAQKFLKPKRILTPKIILEEWFGR